jgi:uncharacterized protein (DUF427 family)
MMVLPQRVQPAPGQESVWDYPRPPRVERCSKHIEIFFNGVRIADSHKSMRVLETSHPPVYYLPPEDVHMEFLLVSSNITFCEWKGTAHYHHLQVKEKVVEDVVWYYPDPAPGYDLIRNYLAFYPAPMDICLVDGEKVVPQPGDFYGGWITRDIVGPFKGEPGSWNW